MDKRACLWGGESDRQAASAHRRTKAGEDKPYRIFSVKLNSLDSSSQPSLTSISHQHLWSVVKFMYNYTSTHNTYTQYHNLPLQVDKTRKKEGKKGGEKSKINTAKQDALVETKVPFSLYTIQHLAQTRWQDSAGDFKGHIQPRRKFT